MSTLPPLAVTGSTGALGGLVARGLADRGVAQRLLARTPARAPVLDGAVALPFSFADRPSTVAALRGARTLLMVSASESADRLDQHRTFVDAAVEAGVGHIVYTSFYGAGPGCTFTLGRDHWATEEHIRATGVHFTFLRDNFYLDFLPDTVGDDGVIRGPAGDGVVAAVTRDDVAASASVVLTEPGAHVGSTYVMTGPEAITMTQVAETISRAQGREVRFHHETLEEAYESRRKWSAPDWQNDAWVSTYTAIAAGEMAAVSDDVRRLTGRRPMSLADWLEQQ
jgi:NAD(P)H dehydrogenase (quinone)